MSNFQWNKPEDHIELHFHMQKRLLVQEPCDYHKRKGEYDDGCYDCGHYDWFDCPLDEKLLQRIDENGYVGRNVRLLSNAIKSDSTVRQQLIRWLEKVTRTK